MRGNAAVVAGLVVLVLAGGCAHQPVKRFPAPPPQVDLRAYLDQQLRANQDPEVALAVALSGGGHRAGNFGTGVLAALESHGLLKEVDYLSSVSGGGFAAAAYVGTLIDHLEAGRKQEEYRLDHWLETPWVVGIKREDDMLKRQLERGYTHDLVLGLLWPKYWFSGDRGDVLEEAFDDRILGRKRRGRSLLLRDVFRDRAAARCQERCPALVPYWVTNATVFENGAIFPLAPDVLRRYRVNGFRHRGWGEPLADGSEGDVPLAVGVKASASFPVAVPATTLASAWDYTAQEQPDLFLQLLDGGVADNLGIYTAMSLLEADRTARRKVLLVVDAFVDADQPYSGERGAPGAFAVGLRMMGIGLDANHVRVRQTLASMAAEKGIQVVFLGIADLGGSVEEANARVLEQLAQRDSGQPPVRIESLGADDQERAERLLALIGEAAPEPSRASAAGPASAPSDAQKLEEKVLAREKELKQKLARKLVERAERKKRASKVAPDGGSPGGAAEPIDPEADFLASKARDVETSFNVTREEQLYLLAAGRKVVSMRIDAIRAALAGRGTPLPPPEPGPVAAPGPGATAPGAR